MRKALQSLILLLGLLLPLSANADYVQLADGVYRDGTTLYIGSGVTSIPDLQLNPSVIYCYAVIPPACVSNTFTGYGATLHVPTASMVSYFSAQYWYNFTNVQADAVEPQSVNISKTEAQVEFGKQLSLTASVTPSNATPSMVSWSSTNTAVATVSGGTVTTVAPGECDIIAWCACKQAVCHVTVTPERVTITLDKHEAKILPNHLLTLTATCTPVSTDLTVISSDNTVAMPRLVNGTIQVLGLKEGTATITVGSVDGTANTDACQVTVYTENGDVNCDGFVNISDVTDLIDYLLNGNGDSVSQTNADCDKDGSVNIADVTTLIDYLLGGIDLNPPVTETFTVNGVTFTMVEVEGGTFTMGATAEQVGDADSGEYPTHQVTLSSYYIGQTEVTQALWQAVMGSNPSEFIGDLQRPVEMVSWNDCQTFITKLNEMTGKQFRLPTEAEWEYAARGGNKSQSYKYAGSNNINEVAWWGAYENGNSEINTHVVATKAPNELGLYDMSGNVWEWCQDWYGSYSSESRTNPTGPASGSYRVSRGGSWGSDARGCRVSYHRYYDPPMTRSYVGLRLSRDPDDSPKFRLSETAVEIEVGESRTIDILNGTGNYRADGVPDIVDVAIHDEQLTITRVAEGTNSLTLVDENSDYHTTLSFVVKEWVPVTEAFTVNDVTFKMVAIEGGTFTIGATAEQSGDATWEEYPAHQVTLSGYCIGQTEVTQALWQAVMGSNPSYFQGNLQHPVEQVSWEDCQTFITKLNEMTGKTFRLPTEAEWEYAARGGKRSQGYKYAGSNIIDYVAWNSGNSSSTTHAVATKAPNELGLYDMSGNVFEWCQDWYGSYSSESQTNPTGPASGYSRVGRSGCWESHANYCRISYRNYFNPEGPSYYLGLRLAMNPQ